MKEIVKYGIENNNFNENSNKTVKFSNFDDLSDYFLKIRDFENKYRVQIHSSMIDSESNWNLLV